MLFFYAYIVGLVHENTVSMDFLSALAGIQRRLVRLWIQKTAR